MAKKAESGGLWMMYVEDLGPETKQPHESKTQEKDEKQDSYNFYPDSTI